ncbi:MULTISPECIES: hypothetical protein [unclassified Archaeoglobus]|uniref:hypothetical protein n=1 Tax=unclassified Archaeoglobus TaxID=2643606 RepID=UPI0025C4AAD9|nr:MULTISPECIES: hypothetical protein [unclassified Archaeoglobus]
MKRWVGFSMLLACVMLLAVADTALTLYSLNTVINVYGQSLALDFELNPLYRLSPEAFFFAKGMSTGIIAIIAYELRSRNPVLAEKGLLLCTALLAAIVVWNLTNILISLKAMEVMR